MSQEEIKKLKPGDLIRCKGAFSETILEVHRLVETPRYKGRAAHLRPIVKAPGTVLQDERPALAWPPEDVLCVVRREEAKDDRRVM